ncbi:MAG: hypothetical protein K5662_07660 [Lachnospiraceae bacterium]|nr:hypothetical protein [Lachnospiraceae bacterium]
MSNPGVIKLASEKIYNHNVWLDDNIGESIHLHIDDWRFDFSINSFEIFTRELTNVINNLVSLEDFDVNKWDIRFVHQLSPYIKYISKINKEECYLSKLNVLNDNGIMINLTECSRVKALQGTININDTKNRASNWINETNESRLTNCLEYIKEHGYEMSDNCITVVGRNNLIIDGWHRASCLYYLNGDIKLPVKKIYFKEDFVPLDEFHFPGFKIPQNSKVILYGAGKIGQMYYNQIKKTNYCKVVAWVDACYNSIKPIDDYSIEDPKVIPTKDFDYVIIAIGNMIIKNKVHSFLTNLGINSKTIII